MSDTTLRLGAKPDIEFDINMSKQRSCLIVCEKEDTLREIISRLPKTWTVIDSQATQPKDILPLLEKQCTKDSTEDVAVAIIDLRHVFNGESAKQANALIAKLLDNSENGGQPVVLMSTSASPAIISSEIKNRFRSSVAFKMNGLHSRVVLDSSEASRLKGEDDYIVNLRDEKYLIIVDNSERTISTKRRTEYERVRKIHKHVPKG